ncbi:hypothetical protein [Komagataeibacter oboediens]|nr:hypothetical protein [Komagataeibacter oboediens]
MDAERSTGRIFFIAANGLAVSGLRHDAAAKTAHSDMSRSGHAG